ncbi:MAG: AEC family transporter [Synechococcales bacterium]|nr:AEC family transporter [Synechococcales bacterium]
MTDMLLQAYVPLLGWTVLGFLLFLVLPDQVPRLLGRALFWVGVPLEILALTRQTRFSAEVGLSPAFTIAVLLVSIPMAWFALQALRRVNPSAPEPAYPDTGQAWNVQLGWENQSRQGSFLISSAIGNTGFVGLAIAPIFVSDSHLSWIVSYSVTHNIVGTYGLGVLIASYFGRSAPTRRWWMILRDVLTVPSLWAFGVGVATQNVPLPLPLETGLHASVGIVIPLALALLGMRISQIRGWQSLRLSLLPAAIKVLVLPALVGLVASEMGLASDARLALVLMSGMPTAFAGLILAEEYDLDRDLIASSIVLTTGLLVLTIPLWLMGFGAQGWGAIAR